jgi:hypothetical protein
MKARTENRVVYDLAALSAVKGVQDRPVRRVTLVLAVLFSAVLAWIIVTSLRPFEPLEITVLGSGFAALLTLMLFAAWKSAPGATAVIITSMGLQFQWSSGRIDLLTWSNLSRGFALLDYTPNPMQQKLSGNLWEVRRWTRPASYLTKDAFDAITRSAAAHGLAVISAQPKSNFWGWATCRIVRFHA